MDSGSSTLATMLEATSIAVVGASPRSGSFGLQMTTEALRSPSGPRVELVNPRHREVLDRPCRPTLTDLDAPVDLVLLGVPDNALVEQLSVAAATGAAGAVVFGSAYGLGPELARIAADAGMALCGAGCMGFVNAVSGVRALGYVERFPLPVGPIAWVSHSGSAFSALLRTHRRLAYSLAVSAGQELVTTVGDYLAYALELPETRVAALLLETLRDADGLRAALATAAVSDVPVVALTVGGSPTGRALVDAHSGAVAGDDAAWEALFDAYGVHRVADLDEMVDTLELFAIGRRARPTAAGLATVHDSGAERALVADVAHRVGVPFAPLAPGTLEQLAGMLYPGLVPGNPLDVWGTGADTRALFRDCLSVMAQDPAVGAVALAVDCVPEYDGDESYVEAVLDAYATTDVAMVVLSNAAVAVDQARAGRLRGAGVPVLEGTRSGLVALRHLLARSGRLVPPPTGPLGDEQRASRWRRRLRNGGLDGRSSLELLANYGLSCALPEPAGSVTEAVSAAERLGYPVVLKTDEPGRLHKSDVGGVLLGLATAQGVRAGFERLASLGPRVLVQSQLAPGVELSLGVVRDPALGPLLVLAVGGTLVELLAERVVALPPLDGAGARRILARLPAGRLLDGVRGEPAVDRDAVCDALVAMSHLAIELGDAVDAVDVNPLIVGRTGAVAVDALVIPRG